VAVHGECKPVTRVWGQSPYWGPVVEPLVIGSGGKAPKAEKLCNVCMSIGSRKFVRLFADSAKCLKARGRLPISDNLTFLLALLAVHCI